MRSIAYVVAIMVAGGIMYFLTMTPTKTAESTTPAAAVDSVVPGAEVSSASLTLKVPEMHCPFACYPSVKENLEKREDVVAVELAPQKEEGVIDNPEVIVTYKEGFDADKAIALLESVGFSGSSVVAE